MLDEKSSPARLPSNVIYQILDDARGRIYLASGRGIARLTPRPGDPDAYDVYTFTVRDGLPFGECNQAASLVDRAGRLWVGTSTAVAVLDPSAPEPKPGPSPLHLERITVDGRELAPAGAPLRLGEKPVEVVFEYALLSYFREPDTRYRVQLVGWQDKPSDWIPDPVQRFSNLTAGSYRFRVWGRDAAGVVSGPVEVAFVIPISPWRTGWAYLLYIVAAGLLSAAGCAGGSSPCSGAPGNWRTSSRNAPRASPSPKPNPGREPGASPRRSKSSSGRRRRRARPRRRRTAPTGSRASSWPT